MDAELRNRDPGRRPHEGSVHGDRDSYAYHGGADGRGPVLPSQGLGVGSQLGELNVELVVASVVRVEAPVDGAVSGIHAGRGYLGPPVVLAQAIGQRGEAAVVEDKPCVDLVQAGVEPAFQTPKPIRARWLAVGRCHASDTPPSCRVTSPRPGEAV